MRTHHIFRATILSILEEQAMVLLAYAARKYGGHSPMSYVELGTYEINLISTVPDIYLGGVGSMI